jgi:hypothetical protein
LLVGGGGVVDVGAGLGPALVGAGLATVDGGGAFEVPAVAWAGAPSAEGAGLTDGASTALGGGDAGGACDVGGAGGEAEGACDVTISELAGVPFESALPREKTMKAPIATSAVAKPPTTRSASRPRFRGEPSPSMGCVSGEFVCAPVCV